LTAFSLPLSSNASTNNQAERVFRIFGRDNSKKRCSSFLIPLPLFTRLTNFYALLFKGVDEIWQCVGAMLKDLMQESPEEVKRSPLKPTTAIVKERENKGAVSDARHASTIANSVF